MGGDTTSIVTERDGPVALIRIDRPDRLNAFTFAMVAAIRDAVDAAAADPTVVGIVVTGTGTTFSAGLDMGDLGASSKGLPSRPAPAGDPPGDPELPALFGYLLQVPKPVIAAVNGTCAGGSLVLAMMCDMRFAAPDAVFTTAFSKRGLIAEHGTAWLLPRLMGTSRALDVLWSARTFDAAEAYRLGFVDRLVPGEQLLDEASRFVRDLAARVAPRSVAIIKRQVYAGLSQSIEESCADADARMRASLTHPDLIEGVTSFVERRPPRFAPLEGDPSR